MSKILFEQFSFQSILDETLTKDNGSSFQTRSDVAAKARSLIGTVTAEDVSYNILLIAMQ